ncbi:MAG: TSUP family transporter, partial [Aquaspirillum sp.]
FLIFLFIRFFAFDFLHASAAAKFVNFSTNLAALSFFVPSGHLLLHFAVPMAVCNVAGSLVGTRLAMRGGAGLVRVLFLVLLTVLIGKFSWDLWQQVH